ncbi:MAG TPA: hypothetical protein VFA39_11000 [Steroidobacteraceae bacterium]|nr:hypothetical protein [Steroidobacteraceae bacterium]
MRALNNWQQFGLCNMSLLVSLKPSIYTGCRPIVIITAGLQWLGFYPTDGQMIPLDSLGTLKPVSGLALVSLYNLHPSASIIGRPPPPVT